VSPVLATAKRIAELVRAVARDERHLGVLSTGERCAVVLVLDRPDLARQYYGTLLECADRVGPECLQACLILQRYAPLPPPNLPEDLPTIDVPALLRRQAE
jgi:hypothetical protein